VIVLDSSAAVEWLLGRAGAPAVSRHLLDAATTVHAPAVMPVEVTAAVRGLVLGRHATPARGRDAVTDLTQMDVTYHDPLLLVGRAWELRDNLSAYDAVYVALAELLGATLVTGDARIARAPGISIEIDVV
jgi:predicted nucleic acid-binding protein